MAYNQQRINPLDLQPRKAIGVSLPFSGKAVFNSTFTTKDAIRNNLINLLLTNKGERVFNPNFGSRIRRTLFEGITNETVNNLKLEIQDLLELYFPSLNIEELAVEGNPNNQQIGILLKYNVSSTNIEDEIVINVET